jgi:hypothetical protein
MPSFDLQSDTTWASPALISLDPRTFGCDVEDPHSRLGGVSAVLRDKITSAYGLQHQVGHSLAEAPRAADRVPFSQVSGTERA